MYTEVGQAMHSHHCQTGAVSEILDYSEAVEAAQASCEELSLLLGNGFSIDYDPMTFRYESLAAEAKLPGLSVAKEELFDRLGTDNFELIIERLRAAAALETTYQFGVEVAERMESDARVVRNGLADVIAARHPDRASVLTSDEIMHARTFLSPFKNIFTLSYDLLLYWVVNAVDTNSIPVPRADGFEWPSFKSRDVLVWKSRPGSPQRIHFLHGALHLFVTTRDDSAVLTKLG